MCRGCYASYGSPKIYNDKVKTLVEAIKAIYSESPVGGNLHIATDDWNLDKGYFPFIEKHDLSPKERQCLELLKSTSLSERASALGIVDDFWCPEELLQKKDLKEVTNMAIIS
jgi:hypothetical protein